MVRAQLAPRPLSVEVARPGVVLGDRAGVAGRWRGGLRGRRAVLMTREIHPAYIEGRVDGEGDRYFVASCAEALIQCGAFVFPDVRLGGVSEHNGEEQALARALEYLGGRG